jgi:hypothetical protein
MPSTLAHVRTPDVQLIVPTCANEVGPMSALVSVEPDPATLPAPSEMLSRSSTMLMIPGSAT